MQFLKECTQEKTDYNIRQIVSLAEYSRKTIKEIRDETNIQYPDNFEAFECDEFFIYNKSFTVKTLSVPAEGVTSLRLK